MQFYDCQPFVVAGNEMCILSGSGFFDLLEPLKQIMADCCIKIKTDLGTNSSLFYPTHWGKGFTDAMLSNNIKQISNIASVSIYVEQAIGHIEISASPICNNCPNLQYLPRFVIILPQFVIILS